MRYKEITRYCAVCGRRIKVKVYENGKYIGGHYFGKIPVGDKYVEYWECDDCYSSN